MQFILDSLTLSIQDFVFQIEIPSEENETIHSLVIGGSALELVSMGRVTGNALQQMVSLGSMYSHIITNSTIHPLLENIAYKAMVTRTAGKRFQDLEKGLQIKGESNDAGIVLHVGVMQMTVLNNVLGMIVHTDTTDKHEETHTQSDLQGDTTNNRMDHTSISSILELPLSAVSIVLPNGAKVSLVGLMVNYRLDGTLLQIEGRDGFLMDSFPILTLGETSLWCADLVLSKFTIVDQACVHHDETDVVAFIHGQPQVLQTILQGIDQFMEIYSSNKDTGALKTIHDAMENDNIQAHENDSVPWSASIDGVIALLWESGTEDSAEAMLRGITLAMGPTIEVNIQSIDRIYVPSQVRLLSPLTGSVLTFNGSSVHLALGSMEVELLVFEESSSKQDTQEPEKKDEESKPFSLPVGIKLTLESLRLKKPDDTALANLTGIVLALSPEPPDEIDAVCIAASLHLDDVNHDMIRLVHANLAGVLHTNNLELVDGFAFGTDSIALAAGYTILDWRGLLGKRQRSPQKHRPNVKKEDSQLPRYCLPFSHVDELKLKLLVNGVVGMKESTQRIAAFKGNANTTSEDLISYYAKKVIAAAPGLISNAEVLGVGVTDTAVGHYGSVFGATIMSGLGKAAGPAGGILSIAAFDGVRNALKAGKQSRGAAVDDKWKPTDLVRGLAYAAKQATRDGATKRGKQANAKGDIVDWTVGATSDVVEYAGENKSRLGAAGAGTFGFFLGAAVAGPVGGLAGAVLISAVTGKTINTLESFGRKDSTSIADRVRIKAKQDGVAEVIEYSIEDHQRHSKSLDEDDDKFDADGTSHSVSLKGVLAKRRDFLKWDWLTYFFMLEDNKLNYYNIADSLTNKAAALKNNDSSTQVEIPTIFVDDLNGPKKTLNLQGLLVEVDDGASSPNEHLFVFTIIMPGKRDPLWVLGAPTERYRTTWIAALRHAMFKVTASVPVSPDCFIEERKCSYDALGGEGDDLEIDLESHPPPLRGVLAKRRDFFKWDWRTHYFTLEDCLLKYYMIFDQSSTKMSDSNRDNNSAEMKSAIYVDDSNGPKKSLHLRGKCVDVDDALSKPLENLFVFTISAPGEKYPFWVLGAPSESYRTKWVAGLRRECSTA